ncbi:MAG: hypothetical protein IJ070_02040 [Firmicutes bacterium]|nr:hypothetical protein [Bacillota bacterium]
MLNNKPVLIVISLLISIGLWLYVTGQVDPEMTAKINNVPVSIVNQNQLSERNLAVVQDEDIYVNATIKGKRSYVNKVKMSGMKAYIDVADAQKGVNVMEVDFETPTGITVENGDDATCSIKVEERISKEIPVKVEFTGRSSDGEYVPWATEIYPETVTAYGPRSIITAAESAVAKVDGSDVSLTEKNKEVDIQGQDPDGKIITSLEFNNSTVMVTERLLKVGDVKLNLSGQGLSSDFTLDSISGPETVRVVASESRLAGLTSISGTVDLSEVKEGGVVFLPVEVELPYGVYQYEDINENAKVTIKVAN